MFQMKEQDKTPEELGEVKIDNLPNKEVKVMIVNMIKELRIRRDEQPEKLEVLNKDLEYIKNNQTDKEYNKWNENYTKRN